ncbi:MAG TPA: ATP-binding protein, partial [Nannocystis sp.]
MQSAETTSPYPGPRPFTAAERDRFFGRTRELQDLAALVIAHPVTVLYGPTGAGKTSLICAGVIPELERAGFDVMPLARVGGLLPPGTDAARLRNVFTYSVLLAWAPDGADEDALARHTLASYLRAMPGVDDGVRRPRVIALDQLEDLFTAHPAQWEQREAFLRELAECLRSSSERSDRNDRPMASPSSAGQSDPPMRLLLAIRDDRLADLERHADLFPDSLRARLPLDGLRVPAAMEAISGPASNLFSGTDAEQLARNLAQRRVRLANGKLALVPSDRVEPMQLQLACDERFQRGGRSGAMAKPRDPDEALTRFYDLAV